MYGKEMTMYEGGGVVEKYLKEKLSFYSMGSVRD